MRFISIYACMMGLCTFHFTITGVLMSKFSILQLAITACTCYGKYSVKIPTTYVCAVFIILCSVFMV